MDVRQRKELSEQELAVVQRSEDSMRFYMAAVSEIMTYRKEIAEITAFYNSASEPGNDEQREYLAHCANKRAQLLDLEQRALAGFKDFRETWLNDMLPEHSAKVLAVANPLDESPGVKKITHGVLFANKQLERSKPEAHQQEIQDYLTTLGRSSV